MLCAIGAIIIPGSSTITVTMPSIVQDQERSNIPVRDNNSLLTAEDVARIFQVPVSRVYGAVRGRKKKQMPHIMIGRYVRFEEQAVRDYINASKKAYPNVKTVAGRMN